MALPRNLNRWVDGDSGREAVRRTLVEMDQRLARFEQVSALGKTGGNGNGREMGLSEFQQRQVLDLVAGRSTSVIGQDTPDPVLAGLNNGTVTSFSAGDLNPLFTTNEATVTTTPALTFAQINQTANLIFAGPASGGAANPAFRSLTAADLYAIGVALLSSTIVNLNSTAAQDLYTVPLGKSLVTINAIARSASVDVSAYASDVPLKENGSGDSVINAFTSAQWSNLSDSTHFIPSPGFDGTDAPYKIVPTGNKVRAIPAGAFGSAATVVIDLYGILF